MDRVIGYAYDYQNRWVRKAWDRDGDGHVDGRRIFIYDVAPLSLWERAKG